MTDERKFELTLEEMRAMFRRAEGQQWSHQLPVPQGHYSRELVVVTRPGPSENIYFCERLDGRDVREVSVPIGSLFSLLERVERLLDVFDWHASNL